MDFLDVKVDDTYIIGYYYVILKVKKNRDQISLGKIKLVE
jgi:hypothetical protein